MNDMYYTIHIICVSMEIGDRLGEIKVLYVYRDGEMYLKPEWRGKKTSLKKHTGTHGRGFFWILKGLRVYESEAQLNFQYPPNPQ
jgi:hypothetical protein